MVLQSAVPCLFQQAHDMKRNLIKANSRQSQERLGKNIGGRGDYGGQNERAKDDKFSSFFSVFPRTSPVRERAVIRRGILKITPKGRIMKSTNSR